MKNIITWSHVLSEMANTIINSDNQAADKTHMLQLLTTSFQEAFTEFYAEDTYIIRSRIKPEHVKDEKLLLLNTPYYISDFAKRMDKSIDYAAMEKYGLNYYNILDILTHILTLEETLWNNIKKIFKKFPYVFIDEPETYEMEIEKYISSLFITVSSPQSIYFKSIEQQDPEKYCEKNKEIPAKYFKSK